MKAMILAAGRGERLRPLTDTVPKPLIKAGDYCLIEYHLQKLAKAGINDVVINTAWLSEVIQERLGDGSQYQLNIHYSNEHPAALETAGGIIKALPILGEEPFIIMNGDIWTDFDITRLVKHPLNTQAHLVLVNNPTHNIKGDFGISDHYLTNTADIMYTYSGIALFTAEFFNKQPNEKSPLAPLLRNKCEQNLVSAEHYNGYWTDVGTEQRLNDLNQYLA